ncbi:DsbA family protein [Amycolatopsis suaedae]|uniref:Thioredoxin-like fold domain-containing protein n=1 Tax=Amycolatopsis suaedae TaxID=2510978 RepID=A0A4Q7J7B9_9PSEU|nr:thioredoxin domain-containing protein [Amycolatopsis suaedae]RZQ62243.1 hypothetical protein EWH70_18325 [Amycolatopsis suaedae]
MGGAERNARKRKQEQQQRSAGAKAVSKARGGGVNTRMVAAVVGVVVLAAAVIGGVIWTNSSKNETEGQTIATGQPAGNVASVREGVVVVTGKPDAKATIDVYADFLCPACGQFEKTYGPQIHEQVEAGALRVRTHMLPMLVEQSDPPGYSLDSANAALCAADDGKFTQFHDALFHSQPEEGKRGYDKAQLIKLGQDLGITNAAFPACVNAGTYNQQLTAELARAQNDPGLQRDFPNGRRGFGTPTVAVAGKAITLDQDWLTKVLAAPQP